MMLIVSPGFTVVFRERKLYLRGFRGAVTANDGGGVDSAGAHLAAGAAVLLAGVVLAREAGLGSKRSSM